MAKQHTGTLSSLVRDVAWASGGDRQSVNRWIRRLQALGVVTVDWRRAQWTSNPCEITDLPGGTQTALLMGARPASPAFYDHLGAVVEQPPPEDLQLPLPATVWLQYTEPSQVRDFAAATGANVAACTADVLTRSLAPFDPGPSSDPPARSGSVEKFDPVTGRFTTADLTRQRPLPGLYRYALFGRLHRYALLRQPPRQTGHHRHDPAVPAQETWHQVDRRAGIHHVLPPTAFPLQWRPYAKAGPVSPATLGRLTASWTAPLPLAQERAAVSCTGLAALRTTDGERYDGVPFRIADRIAHSLHRRLETS
jgi:hypothetical protein